MKNYRKQYKRPTQKTQKAIENQDSEFVRLNKFIADAGVCSRREADQLIEVGAVKVNDEIITKLGSKIRRTDKVEIEGQTLKTEKLKYFMLNKPKDFITTSSDPKDRRTVMQLVKNACRERIYPVGRLDRNTTGILLFTNDGILADKLMHPSSNIEKQYLVGVDKNIKMEHLQMLLDGIKLDDGFIKADKIDYANQGVLKSEAIITIHSGKNRIVRRMFEHFGYKVKKLDRIRFGGLTKQALTRGKWRELEAKEVSFLKML